MQGRKLGLVLLSVMGLVLAVYWTVGNADEAVPHAVDAPATPAALAVPGASDTGAAVAARAPTSIAVPPLAALLDGEAVVPMRSLPGRVRGRLAWQGSGLPLEGALVRAVRAFPDTVLVNDVEQRGQDRLPLRRRELLVGEPATTDPFGLFELAVPEIDGPLALLALRNGQCIEVRPLQPGPAARQTIELGDWLLQARGQVQGVVVDHHNQPVRAARVRLIDVPLEGGAAFHPLAHAARLYGARDFEPRCVLSDNGAIVDAGPALALRDDVLPFPEVLTDESGRFVLTDARPGAGTLVIQPEVAPNFAEQVVVLSGEVSDVGVLRLRAGLVAGQLFAMREGPGSTDDVPLVGAEVTLLPADGELLTPPVITGGDGAFTSPKLAEAPLRAFARRTPARPWENCFIDVDGPRLRLRLPFERTLRVEVWAGNGRSAAGCRVEIRHARVFGSGFDLVTTIPETEVGVYEAKVPRVGGLLVVRADGYAPLAGFAAAGTLQVRLQEPTLTTRFVVRTASGEPVERASLYARVFSERGPGKEWHSWAEMRPGHVKIGETDGNGVLVCDGLWRSDVEVVAFHPRLGVAERTLRLEPEVGEHVLILGDRTRGRLLGLLTENRLPPQDRWLVVAQRAEPPAITRAMLAEADGSFAFGGLTSGSWQLSVVARVGPTDASPLMWPVMSAAHRRGWPQGKHRVDVVAGTEQHTTMEIRQWVDDLSGGSLQGVVRIDGVPARGLAIHAHEEPDDARDDLKRRLAELDAMMARSPSGRAREQVVREWASVRRRIRPDGPASIASIDERGRFAIDARSIHRLDVVAHVEGLTRILWSGPSKGAGAIDIRTGSAVVEVQARDGLRLASRMFVAEGQGDLAGVRVPAVADRFGVLRLDGVPCGAYALRALTQGGAPVAFPTPAFTVTGANWARATVAAR